MRLGETTKQLVIASILELKDIDAKYNYLVQLEDNLVLTEVEKNLIRTAKDLIESGNDVDFSGIKSKHKFDYYFSGQIILEGTLIPKEELDFGIIDLKRQQEKQDIQQDLLDLSANMGDLTHAEIVEKLSQISSKATSVRETKAPENSITKSDNAYAGLERKDGLSLLIPKVEELAGKVVKGDVAVILAFTGSFKTVYALNIAYKNALEGKNMLYLGLEDTGARITSRLVVNHIAETAASKDELINNKDIRDGNLTEEQIKLYNDKHNEFADLISDNLIVWDSTQIDYKTFSDMTATLKKADKIFKEKTGSGLYGVVVDQLALLKYAESRKATYDGAVMNEWVSYFREQSLNFADSKEQLAVIIISQINRESYKQASRSKSKGEYSSTAGSDSNELERSAATMITLYKDAEVDDMILVSVPKARYGETTTRPIQVEVYGQYSHIGPLKVFEQDRINLDDFTKEKQDLSIEILLDLKKE